MKNLIVILFLLVISSNIRSQPVHICDDSAEWPPYIYYSRMDNKLDKSNLNGATIDLFKEIFKLAKLEYSIQLRPWKRCLLDVENFGKKQRYEVFSNGSFSRERAKKYYVSTPIYQTNQGLFYSTKKYPNGLAINKLSDLNNFKKICGIHGYSYEEYKLNQNPYQGANDITTALKMLSLQRCDIFLSSIEPVYGGEVIGKYTIPADITNIVIPELKPTTFHLFISKSSPRAYELVTKLNQAILILQHNGISEKIFKKHLAKEK
ncbi:MAG: transporter substrate-binding domain-containing protein [Pseudomonadota bacterium]